MIDKSQGSVKKEKLGTVKNSDDAQVRKNLRRFRILPSRILWKRYQQSSGSSASVIIEQRTY